MKPGTSIAIVLILIMIIVGGVVGYSHYQGQQQQKTVQRALQLQSCEAPYLQEEQEAQLQLSNPLYVVQGNAALAHATDGLRACQQGFGPR